MPRRELLTPTERLQLLAFPEDAGELIRVLTLSKADIAFVRQHRGDHNRFGIAVLIFSYIWPLFLAYLGGAMSMLDPAGRIIAMSVTSQTIGMAFGPAVAGVIAVHFGYVAIAVLGLACFAVAFVLLVPLFITLRAHA